MRAGDSPCASSTTLQCVVVNMPGRQTPGQSRSLKSRLRGGAHTAITVKRRPEASPHVRKQMLIGRVEPAQLRRQHVESVTSLSTVCVRTFSTVAPIFDPSRSRIQTCWPCSKGPRAITSVRYLPRRRIFEYSTQIASASRSRPVASIYRLFSASSLQEKRDT